jgi:hypothetical protein
MTCPDGDIVFTILAGCPASHRLNFLYPVNLTIDEWLSGNITDEYGNPLLIKIEVGSNNGIVCNARFTSFFSRLNRSTGLLYNVRLGNLM